MRSVPARVYEDYMDWWGRKCYGGVFNVQRYKGSSRRLGAMVNIFFALILTPWFLAHRFAFQNHNTRPYELKNKIGYAISCVLSIGIDLTIVGIGGIWFYCTYLVFKKVGHNIGTWMSFSLSIAVWIVSVIRIPDLCKINPPAIEFEEPENNRVPESIEEDEIEDYDELAFCQIIRLNRDTDLHIIKVEYCPDETAFIRIVSENSYTKPYKKKVQRDKRGSRYIVYNNEKFYLDPEKTQPRMPE